MAENTSWEGIAELEQSVESIQDAAKKFADATSERTQDETDQAADALIKKLQAAGDAAATFTKSVRRLAEAAEAEKDKAKKAPTKAKADAAAKEAREHADAAKYQSDAVKTLVETATTAASTAMHGTHRQANADSVARKISLEFGNAEQYVRRAKSAAEAAENIAKTA